MSSQIPARIVVTGANRGLGLEFVRQYLEEGQRVFGLCRHPEQARELEELQRQTPEQLTVLACDVADDASVAQAAARVAQEVDGIELLINNAGFYGSRAGGEESIRNLDCAEAVHAFEVNALGPLRLARALLPLLKEGNHPKVVNITSLMGSISNDQSGGHYAYRMSKAALNMASHNMALDLREDGIVAAAVHPGWVKTEMGGPEAPLDADDSVANMIRLIDTLDLQHSGGFFSYRGRELPW
jgi:NAD(P)-dependent dehydrogenase (short-subunit alcohol dehydrogenase family)